MHSQTQLPRDTYRDTIFIEGPKYAFCNNKSCGLTAGIYNAYRVSVTFQKMSKVTGLRKKYAGDGIHGSKFVICWGVNLGESPDESLGESPFIYLSLIHI